MSSIWSVLMILSLLWITPAFAADPVVGPGKNVSMDYTLTVDNEQVESSVGKSPLVFDVGANTIIPGLESQILGMHEGEEKLVSVEAKDAYGEVDPKAIKEFPLSSMPKDSEPKVGMVLQAQAPDGEEFPAVIKAVTGDKVTLDFNHPLAGKQLKFKVKILAIKDAIKPKEEAKAPAVPALAPAAK